MLYLYTEEKYKIYSSYYEIFLMSSTIAVYLRENIFPVIRKIILPHC